MQPSGLIMTWVAARGLLTEKVTGESQRLVIEAPWLVTCGHGVSLRHQNDACANDPDRSEAHTHMVGNVGSRSQARVCQLTMHLLHVWARVASPSALPRAL
eukprot:COSAG01_NODE_41286_length_453_cov_1.262712_2_plen_100_part_01